MPQTNDPLTGLLIVVMIAAVFLFCTIFYLLPAIIAALRHHPQATLLFGANVFIGWTIIGWILLFLWAAFGEAPHQNLRLGTVAFTRQGNAGSRVSETHDR